MAKAYGYIIIYNNNGDIVYQHKGSGGDYGVTVSLSNNVITISSDYAPQVEPIDDSDPEFPDRWSTVIDTGEVNVSNVSSPTSLKIVLPYNASKIRYFGGQFGEFADSAGSDYTDAIINNGETITLTSNNYSSGGGCAIQYYEEATSKVSADLTTLPGWSSLSDGAHNITIVAKADGYADSEPSAAVSVEKAAAMPVKGDIITLDSKQYRVLKLNGTVAEVLAMYEANSSIKFDSASSGRNNTYAGKNIDTFCNNTFYSGLSSAMKSAIVDKTFTQDSWDRGYSVPTASHYTGKDDSNTTYYVTVANAAFGTSITRHCYCLSIQDVLDYLEATTSMGISDTTLTATNVWRMFWNTTTSQNTIIWSRSAKNLDSRTVVEFNGYSGGFGGSWVDNSRAARPAFQIDLSKISWSK